MVLRGRCRSCAQPIAVRYPLVESITGIAFALSAWRFGVSWPALVGWAFIAGLVALAFIDHDQMIIPNAIVLPGAVVGLAASIGLRPERWWVYLVSALGCAFFFLVLVLLWPGGGMESAKSRWLCCWAPSSVRGCSSRSSLPSCSAASSASTSGGEEGTRKTKVPSVPSWPWERCSPSMSARLSSTHTRACTAKRVMTADLELERNRPLRATVEREGGRYSF